MSELYLEEIEDRHAQRQRHHENSGRHAFTFHRLESTNWGQVEFEEPLDFGISFVQRPTMSYGYYIESDALEDYGFPHCTGFVTEWHRDSKGLYVGAWVGVSVQLGVLQYYTEGFTSFMPSPLPEYVIEHDFTFQGIALKDLPLDVDETD